jgi:Tetratricopeptide repeat
VKAVGGVTVSAASGIGVPFFTRDPSLRLKNGCAPHHGRQLGCIEVVVVISTPEAARPFFDTMDRIATLNEILTENPKDAFARYGLAMEYSKQGDFDRALAEFAILLESHPEYTAGYFMAAQTLVRAERVEEAKKMLQDGIASARRTGNLHAQSEMEVMLTELG